MKQRKHTRLAKRSTGLLANNEWSVADLSPESAYEFQEELSSELGDSSTIGLVITEEGIYDDGLKEGVQIEHVRMHGPEGTLDITPESPMSVHRIRYWLEDCDLVIIAGPNNAEQQIEKNPAGHYRSDAPLIKQSILARTPLLKGLILAGGESSRMGTDKSVMDYHGVPQRDRVVELIAPHCCELYLSCKTKPENCDLPVIEDSISGLGPMSGILSAFRTDPNAAWLVVACDLPHLDAASIDELVQARCRNRAGTAFQNPESGFVEPLITIWEPRMYPELLLFMSQGVNCPRRALMQADVRIIEPSNPWALRNVNSTIEAEQARAEILTDRPPDTP